MEYLWATPSAAGPRSALIVSGLQILGSVASGSWYFWNANLSFGMIGGFALVSWGTLGRFWDTGEHNKGIRLRLLQILNGFWWPWYRPGRPWETLGRSWDDPRALGTTRQDTVRSRLGFYRFLVDLGDPFRESFGYIWSEHF